MIQELSFRGIKTNRIILYCNLNRNTIVRVTYFYFILTPFCMRILATGSASEITEYRRRFDKQDDPLFGEFVPQDFVADVNAVASVLKLYLRELPDPLLEPSALPDVLTHMVASALFLLSLPLSYIYMYSHILVHTYVR